MVAGLLRETGARPMEYRALHHLERSVDWKLWGRELRGLRTRPFFLLLSPARHWLPAQPGSPGPSATPDPFFCVRRRLEENRTPPYPPFRTVRPTLQGSNPVERLNDQCAQSGP